MFVVSLSLESYFTASHVYGTHVLCFQGKALRLLDLPGHERGRHEMLDSNKDLAR